MWTTLDRFRRDESGATAVEYGLMVGLIAVAIIAGSRGLGENFASKFRSIATAVGGG